MKNLLFLTFLCLILDSCMPSVFYQIYSTSASENLKNDNDVYFFEDSNCLVTYNLWSEGGNIGFKFYNKSEKNIYIDLEHCFFIVNGMSKSYYKNRTYTISESSSFSSTRSKTFSRSSSGFNYSGISESNRITNSATIGNLSTIGESITNLNSNTIQFGTSSHSGLSVSYNENKIICIPPRSSQRISEYSLNHTFYRDCILYKYPSNKKKIITRSFSKTESPFVFRNRIAYSLEKSDSVVVFENEFYVNEISNYPEMEIIGTRDDTFCTQYLTRKYYKISAPNMFYLKYTKAVDDYWIH
jgi:hypothetical protein